MRLRARSDTSDQVSLHGGAPLRGGASWIDDDRVTIK